MTDKIHLTIDFTPRIVRFLMVVVLVATVAVELGSETLTMTTTYPSPAGIYRTMITTGNATLARDIPGTSVTVGGGLNTSAALNVVGSASVTSALSVGGRASLLGNVGVGTAAPGAMLDIEGIASGTVLNAGTVVVVSTAPMKTALNGTTTIPNGGNLTIANGATLNINKSVKDSAGNVGSAGQVLALSSTPGGGATWQTVGGGGMTPSCSWGLAAVGYSGKTITAAGCSTGYNAYSITCITTGPSALQSFGYSAGVGWHCDWNGGPNGNSNNMYLLCCNF